MFRSNRFAITMTMIAVLAGVWPNTADAQRARAQVDPDKVTKPKATPQIVRGQLGYTRYCAECHGKNTAGTNKGPTFLSRVYHPGHHGDAAFYRAPKEGARAHHWRFGDMKPVEGVNDAQLEDIIAYIRAVQKANGLF